MTDFSVNTCPLSIDNTLAPGTELLCWDTGPYNQLIFDITGIDAAEYELVGEPGGIIIEPSITADGRYSFSVVEFSRVCLKMVTAGIGTATVNAYLSESINLSLIGFCLPFALTDGTTNNIQLILGSLPFNLFNGTSNNIPVVPC